MSVALLALVIAAALFALAAWGVALDYGRLIALGLLAVTLAFIVERWP